MGKLDCTLRAFFFASPSKLRDPGPSPEVHGQMLYETDAEEPAETEQVSLGSMLAEAALWSQWIHVGKACAGNADQ
eukprot:2690882-Amphidinium_carterae.1